MDSISSVEPDDDLDAVDSIMPIVIKITFDVARCVTTREKNDSKVNVDSKRVKAEVDFD